MKAPWKTRYRGIGCGAIRGATQGENEMSATALSIAMLAVFALMGGALYLLFGRRDLKRGGLMLLAALVIAANVAIWSIPVPVQ